MTISRRSFLSGVAPLIALAAADPAKAATSSFANDNLREEIFRPLIGSTFEVREERRRRGTVTLTDVKSLDKRQNKTRHAFTLQFRQPDGKEIAQGTYRFRHAQAGEFLLFVVPGSRSSATLTAVINRV